MQIELNNLLWLAKRKVLIDSGLSTVNSFFDSHTDYMMTVNDTNQIIEIFRYIVQTKAKYDKSLITNFIDKMSKQLFSYLAKNDNEPQRHELILITITSKEEIFRAISISLLIQLFSLPEKYKFFLDSTVDSGFCGYLLELSGKECNELLQLFKTIAYNDVDFCFNFVNKSLSDPKKLKLIGNLVKSLQDEFLEKFLQNLEEDPKYSMVFVYLLNELSEPYRRKAMSFIISNFKEIDLTIFSQKLSSNSISMKLFVKNENLTCEIALNVLLKITNNFEIFALFSYENFLFSEIQNSEPFLLLLYFIHSKQRKKISIDLANQLFDKFNDDENLYRFFDLLISDNLFLYLNGKNEQNTDFFDRLLNCLLSSCTFSSINLYTTITKMHEGTALNQRIDQLFEVFLNSDESAEQFISDCLLSLFLKNKKSFIYSIDCVFSYYKTIFPREMIENYIYFSKFIYFLEKYFKLSEEVYPISDFKFTPHNKALIEGKEKITIGSQNYEFLISKDDTIQTLLKRISFVFNFDLDLPPNISNSNKFSDVEKFFRNIDLTRQSKILPPPAFFSNETKLSNFLLINITNPKVDENTSSKIANILDYMPDDMNFLALIKKGTISVFTNNLYVKYVILLDHTQMGQTFIRSLVDYFCHCDDICLKQDILTQMKKNLKIIASLNNIDFSQLYKSFFKMLEKPEILKGSYKEFLTFIIDNTKSPLIKYFEKRKKLIIINPPEFLWESLLKLINLVGINKESILKMNRNNEFGVFIAKDIIPQVKLTGKDIGIAFKLLEVHYFINNPNFYISLCQQLISNNYLINKKNMNILLEAAFHIQNEVIISNIFKVFQHFFKIERYKEIFYTIFKKFLAKTKSYDFSFDPKNYEINEWAIKFKPSLNNSPLNSILQIFQNFDTKNGEVKQPQLLRAYVDPTYVQQFPDYIIEETNPVEILKRLDISQFIQFEDEFPEIKKPIFVRENISLLCDIQSDIVKCNRTFKFKGLIANIDSINTTRKFIAIIQRNGKLIKINDNQIELIQIIPKESKNFNINCAIYSEDKNLDFLEKYQYRFFIDTKYRLEYEKVLLAYSNDFQNFILKLQREDLLLVYYVNFVIKMKDVNLINEFTRNLNSLKFSENFYLNIVDCLAEIVKNFIQINEIDVLYNLKKTILQYFLSKIPDKYVILICNSYLVISQNLCIANIPSKVSLILSLFRDFVKSRIEFFLKENDFIDTLNLLNEICLSCLQQDVDDEKYYSILNMHSIFDSIKFFVHILNLNQKKEGAEPIDIFLIFSCLSKLEENHYKILRNKENASSYIFLVQKVFKNDEEYMNSFYHKLFLEEENEINKDEYFLNNLVGVSEKNIEKLFNTYFNQLQITDPNYLFNEIEQFIGKTPSFLVKFLKHLPLISQYFEEFSIEFIPYLNKIISNSIESNQIDILKSILVIYEDEIKLNNGVSIIDFKAFINIVKNFDNENYLPLIVNLMVNEDKKDDDLYCLFFGEFILSCKYELIQPSFIYDIILYKLNDIRVDLALFFFIKFINVLQTDFLIHPKMKDLYLYCIVHNQSNSLLVDDFTFSMYNFLYDIQFQNSKKMMMKNPPSDRFITIAKIVKSKISPTLIKISNQQPFVLIEQSEQFIDYFGFSDTISSLFNFLTNQDEFDFDTKIVNGLIDSILSNEEFDVLELRIKNQNKLLDLIEKEEISLDFKSHLLDLMIFSQSRDENAFNEMNRNLVNLKTGLFELDEKYFYFLTLKALYGEEYSLLPFLTSNIDPFVNSILKITSQPVLLKKEKPPDIIQMVENELNQSNYQNYNFENVKNILLRKILS